jgi:hypothetical protein
MLIVTPSVGGAAFAVSVGVAWLDLTSFEQYVSFSSSARSRQPSAVYLLGGVGGGGATPVRLMPAGVALGARTTASTPLRPVEPPARPRGAPDRGIRPGES